MGKGRQFTPGQSGNPAGGSAKMRDRTAMKRLYPLLAKAAPDLTLENVRFVISGLLAGSSNEMKAAEDQLKGDLLLVYKLVSNTLGAAARKGDITGLLKLIEFVVGKAPDKMELTGKDGSPLTVRGAAMTVEEMQAELAAIRARKKAQGIVG